MTFKDLSFKKKLEHIWEYYRWLILGVLFVLIAGTSIAATILTPKPDNYAGIAVYRTHITQEQTDGLTADLNSALSIGTDKSVTITNYYFDSTDSVFNNDMEQKFITYLYSLELHLVAANQEDTEMFIDSEYIAPLTDYLSEDELNELDAKGMVLYHTDPLDNTEKPFAVNIDSSALLNKYNIFTTEESAYLSVIPIEGYQDNTKAVIRELLK
jgi:hypothetical protein